MKKLKIVVETTTGSIYRSSVIKLEDSDYQSWLNDLYKGVNQLSRFWFKNGFRKAAYLNPDNIVAIQIKECLF